MNLGEIELSIYDRLGFGANPDSAVIRRIQHYINSGHKQILSKKGYQKLRRRPAMPAVSVASSPYMVMMQAATAIIVISDRANNRNLDAVDLKDIRYEDPGLNFSGGIPEKYAVLNYSSPVARDPSAATALYVISDSASDGTGLAVNIEGITTAGMYRRATTPLNGLTEVNVDAGCATWMVVTKFYLSGGAAGNVSLTQGSAGTVLSVIPKGRAYPRYTLVHLSPTPATSQTYYCDVQIHVEDMTVPTDEPLLPEDFHYMLESAGLMREFLRRKDMQEYGVEAGIFKTGMGDLADHLRAKGGVSTGGQRANKGRRYSQLGAMFSNGS